MSKTTRRKNEDLAPICIIKIRNVGGVRLDRPLVALLDTGSTNTLIQQRCIPPGARPKVSQFKSITTTANGTFDTSTVIQLQTIQLPEFVNGRYVDGIEEARLFDQRDCRYDVILGRDFLRKAGIKFCCKTNTVIWADAKIEMKPPNHYSGVTTNVVDGER